MREELRTLRDYQEAAQRREREWEGRYESRGRDLEVRLISLIAAPGPLFHPPESMLRSDVAARILTLPDPE